MEGAEAVLIREVLHMILVALADSDDVLRERAGRAAVVQEGLEVTTVAADCVAVARETVEQREQFLQRGGGDFLAVGEILQLHLLGT